MGAGKINFFIAQRINTKTINTKKNKTNDIDNYKQIIIINK